METITSELITWKNRRGKTLVGYLDFSGDGKRDLIVIPPAFGETKRDGLKLSYCLVKNGFTVLRYDATDHVGESQGEMHQASFSSMKDDLFSALDYLQTRFSASRIGICGTSLGIRVALKTAAEDKRIACVCGIVGLVDLRSSLKTIYHQDVIGEIIAGNYKGKTIDDIMGFEVSVDFALSAIKDGFCDLASTRQDMEKITVPVLMMNAENDPWIRADDVRSLCPAESNRHFALIPGAMHQINENPEAALFVLAKSVGFCALCMQNRQLSAKDIVFPTQEEMGKQWLIEEGRLRVLLQKSLEGEKQFWEKYLNKFVLIQKSGDYRGFLTDISETLQINPGDVVLDAGCGNGHFGAWLLDKQVERMFKERLSQKDFKPVTYVGLDFTEHSLHEATLKHLNMTRRVYKELSLRDKYPLVRYRYSLADLEQPLPFNDNTFDKICCNLVISYVKDPEATLRELVRVLKPGGKILLSSMKPDADLSSIYRNFVDMTENQEELEEARMLLSAAGRIKQKEHAGIYRFFSGEELEQLIQKTGARTLSVARTFANQANLLAGEKRA